MSVEEPHPVVLVVPFDEFRISHWPVDGRQTVGVTQIGSDADTFLHLALQEAGMTPQEVTIVQHGGSPQGVFYAVCGFAIAAVFTVLQLPARKGKLEAATPRT